MTKLTTRIATALLLGVLCAAPAFAKAKSRLLTVGQDFVVGATTVKAGTYVFSVDSESNELTVLDKKTKAVIARAQTTSQPRGKGPFRLDFQLVDNNGTMTLASIAFDGEKNSYTIAGTSTAAR
jgi:YVTN family beta-propeller protein